MNFIFQEQAGIDVAALSQTFDSTDSSYKFLWFYSLLEILKRRNYSTAEPIACREMAYLMLRLAKEPCHKFHLSLGAKDRMCQHICRVEEKSGNVNFLWEADDTENAPHLNDNAFDDAQKNITLYVPSRWLHPFVKKHTILERQNKTRNQKRITRRIVQAAEQESKGDNPPPYYIRSTRAGDELVVHPQWAAYFAQHERVMRDWCLWNFARYLEKRNPNIPNILSKISFDENKERNLGVQREYWQEIIQQGGELRCIYSGEVLASKKDFALDHYVPWSFVGHDNLWNLIPASKVANSSKSDRLPSNVHYLDKLVQAHCRALAIRTESFPRKWPQLIESYSADLKLEVKDLTDPEKVHRAYQTFVPPLMDLAKANRFQGDWVYRPCTSAPPIFDK